MAAALNHPFLLILPVPATRPSFSPGDGWKNLSGFSGKHGRQFPSRNRRKCFFRDRKPGL